jgi:DNA polymerase elongation subunit (family B)/DNA-directed RNA polymerase subunit RPC12/RpoP
MKILLLDIETAPNMVYTWGLFNQYVDIHKIIKPGYTLSWAAKWLGEEDVMFDSVYHSTPKQMVKRVHKLMEEADAVIHYNGTKFDIPILNKEFLLAGLEPTTPVAQIDLLKTVRRQFKMTSNKLDFVAQALGLGTKEKHKGFELWTGCMKKDPECWEVMERYNKQDVILLEKLYTKLLPWIKGHPNMSVYYGEDCCPHCGSTHFVKKGKQQTAAGIYQRYKCNTCKTPFRGSVNEALGIHKMMEVR